MPKIHTMTVREHVRGGYRELSDGPHIVMNGGKIEGVWYPGTSGIAIDFTGTHALLDPAGTIGAAAPAPKPLRPARRRPAVDLTRRA